MEFYIHYENLKDDLAKVLDSLGLESKGALPVVKKVRQGGQPYRAHYTEGTRRMVGQLFEKELALRYRF